MHGKQEVGRELDTHLIIIVLNDVKSVVLDTRRDRTSDKSLRPKRMRSQVRWACVLKLS
jgi:hypothetical protein